MAVTNKQWGKDILSADELMDSLEEIRSEYTGGNPAGTRRDRSKDTIESIAAQKRRGHQGGDGNHRFEGERYIAITDNKEVRRFQLRKLIDEGGQDSVGGPIPSHPTLQAWHSNEFGVSMEEVHQLEMTDSDAGGLVRGGWWYYMHRYESWPVLLGSALVGEGAKRLPAVRERMIQELDENREWYQQIGIKDIDKAMLNQIEHSPIGADQDHVVFGENMTREYITTPEMQERIRQVFTLRLQQSRI